MLGQIAKVKIVIKIAKKDMLKKVIVRISDKDWI